MMSAAQAFESFSQEEEEAAREAYPASQGVGWAPHVTAADINPGSSGPEPPPTQPTADLFPAQPAVKPPDVFSPQQPRADTVGEGAEQSHPTPPPVMAAQPPPPVVPHLNEAPPRQEDVRPPLGPPDLVDHGPSHPPLPPHPAPQGPPDLTQAQAQPPSSHDDHYNWYSDQQAGGMPDVTGVQVGSKSISELSTVARHISISGPPRQSSRHLGSRWCGALCPHQRPQPLHGDWAARGGRRACDRSQRWRGWLGLLASHGRR